MKKIMIVMAALLMVGALASVGVASSDKHSEGWLLSVDETAGVIQLAVSPSETVTLSVNEWVISRCQRLQRTYKKGYEIWMDVTICPGSNLGCAYSYGIRKKA